MESKCPVCQKGTVLTYEITDNFFSQVSFCGSCPLRCNAADLPRIAAAMDAERRLAELQESVAWERECEKCWTWLKPTTFAAMRECYNNFEAARAEVDRLLLEEF